MNSLDVKKIRKQLGVSQEQLAEMIGVHTRTVQNWEAGTAIPKSKHAILHNIATKHLQYHNTESEYPASNSPHGHDSAAPNVDRLLDLLDAKERSLAKAQEHIDKLLGIISNMTKVI